MEAIAFALLFFLSFLSAEPFKTIKFVGMIFALAVGFVLGCFFLAYLHKLWKRSTKSLFVYINEVSFFRQFFRFALIGIFNTLIDFFVLNILMGATGIYKGGAIFYLNAISFSLATVNSYFLNKLWSFEDVAEKSNGNRKFVTFFVVSVIGILLNGLIIFSLTTYWEPFFGFQILSEAKENQALWANLAKAMATAFSLAWNFVGYKFIVFRK